MKRAIAFSKLLTSISSKSGNYKKQAVFLLLVHTFQMNKWHRRVFWQR